jgi:cytochrome c oxidase cbb3-type subunit IV
MMGAAEMFVALRSFWVIWLMLIFIGIVAWSFRPRNKARFEADARIPLRDDEPGES